MDRGFVFNLINDYISGFSPKDPKVRYKDLTVVDITECETKGDIYCPLEDLELLFPFRYLECSYTLKKRILLVFWGSAKTTHVFGGLTERLVGLNTESCSRLRFLTVTQQGRSAGSVRGQDIKGSPWQSVCKLPEHALAAVRGHTAHLLSSSAKAATHVQYFSSVKPIWGLGLLLGTVHVLEAGQNARVLERKGKQVFTTDHIVWTDSLNRH